MEFRSYISGMSSISDFLGCSDAWLPVGVQIQDVSAQVEELIAEYTSKGGLVFVDSGAFPAFIKNEDVDFDKVLARYKRLVDMTARPDLLAMVAPDKIGNMNQTAELQRMYLRQLQDLAAAGVELLVPFQRGWSNDSYITHYNWLETHIGPFTLALACKKEAWLPRDVSKLITSLRPQRVHLLGVGTTNLDAYSDAVLWNSPSTVLSADANRTRVFLGKGRAITEETKQGVARLYEEAAEEFDSCYDGTELDYDLHNEPGYLTKAEARELAKLFGITDKATMNKWGNWSQQEASSAFQKAYDYDHVFGCKLGYLIHETDPTGGLACLIIHAHQGKAIKDILAGMAAKTGQKHIRRRVISTTMSADNRRRQFAYRARLDQGLLFGAA